MPNTSGSVDLSDIDLSAAPQSPEEQEALARLAAEHPEDAPQKAVDRYEVDTAILVVLTKDGEVQLLQHTAPIEVDRDPSLDLLFGMLAVAQKDLSGQEVAQAVVQQQMVTARMVQEQVANAKIQAQLNQSLGRV